MNGYLWNAGCVAAWSEELSDKPLAQRILDTPVVLYRCSDGQVSRRTTS
jgi:phenylpropionate dioxygenase-like ring-hydroxylating dioxygenase large terminal subunit